MNNELSTEVKAQEIHEKAVSFYKISEQYGYKFLMEVKTIRDEKLYKELGFETFEDYTLQTFNYSRETISKRIKSAEVFGEENVEALRHLGTQKINELATMPEEQRRNVIENGIETESGNKSVEDATTREIEKYKKQLKQREQEKAEMQSQLEMARKSEQTAIKQLENEQNKLPETKTEYKEVIPDKVKKKLEQFENDKKLLKQQEKENREIRRRLQKQKEWFQKQIDEKERQLNNKKSFERDERYTENEQIASLKFQVETTVLELKDVMNNFLDDASSTAFKEAAIARSSNRTKKILMDGVGEIENWCRAMRRTVNSTVVIEEEE